MKKLDIKYLWILFIVLMFSCIDDDSKFGGVDIDEIKIEGIKDYQEIEWGGTFDCTTQCYNEIWR